MFTLPTTSEAFKYSLGGGAFSALLFLLAPVVSPLLLLVSLFYQIPLFLVGLHLGFSSQIISSCISLLLITGLTNIYIGFDLLLFNFIPHLLFTYLWLLNRVNKKTGEVVWYPLGRLIAALTGYLIFILAITFYTTLNSKISSQEIALLNDQLFQFSSASLQSHYESILSLIIKLIPSIKCIGILLMTFLNAFLAHIILVKNHKNIRPSSSLSDIELPWWLWSTFAIAGILSYFFPGKLGIFFLNLSVILSFSFLLEGLGIVHQIITFYNLGKISLWIFYGVMILFDWPTFLVIILGVFEPWLKLRTRLSPSQLL